MDQNNLTSVFSNLAKQVGRFRIDNAETQQVVRCIQKSQQDQSIQSDPVEVELTHVVSRAPITNLIYYPELLEVNTLIKENQEERLHDIFVSK
ncbi:hypothetical protein BB561_004864 [Smittium simulii]|uniref:Uncharacterized protein n=1 Tax=Smittium simulii TaxID=133385 RepID=A0A2T9YDT5_9FUNG|nr:hypothetical protein BB561_004864 [Smittium simulii]